MLGRPKLDFEYREAIEAIKGWTRSRFRLDSDAPVLVAEVTCRVEGCPPLETVVAFWTADDIRHQFRIHKAAREVAYDDIGWLMGWPAGHEGGFWDCC